MRRKDSAAKAVIAGIFFVGTIVLIIVSLITSSSVTPLQEQQQESATNMLGNNQRAPRSSLQPPIPSAPSATIYGPTITAQLDVNRIYFFHQSDAVVSGSGYLRTWNFYNRTRRTGSPDPKQPERHTLLVVLIQEPPHSMAFYPNLTLTATVLGADVRPYFYSTDARMQAATLIHCGTLSGSEGARHVLCGNLTLPETEGVFRLGWTDVSTMKRHGAAPDIPLGPLETLLEVTCDDEIFCNGNEYFVRGSCTRSSGNPCIYGSDACMQHACIESKRLCDPLSVAVRNGGLCDICGPQCEPKCKQGQKCGPGGCPACTGGESDLLGCAPADFCGSCTGVDEICLDGQCVVVADSNTPGSCNNPYPLLKSVVNGGLTRVEHVSGNPLPQDGITVPAGGLLLRVDVPVVTNMEDNTKPACGAPGVQEHVFEFTIALPPGSTGQGMEVMAVGLDTVDLAASSTESRFPPGAIDTLLAIHGADCNPLGLGAAAYSICSDDATPPGDLSSHLYTRLTSGSYRLIASFFGTQTGGPYVLMVKFTDAGSTCFPQCDGKFCGSDECQININGSVVPTSCGLEQYWRLPQCNAGTTCLGGRCSNCTLSFINSPAYVSTCTPGSQCGFDQCNQFCNRKEATTGEPACEKGVRACNLQSKKCIPVGSCDNFAPECQGAKQGRGEERFCGSDCKLYRAYDPLPDLTPDTQKAISDSIVFNMRTFNNLTCAIVEGCLGVLPPELVAQGTFTLPLMRFDTNVINLGASFKPPAVDRAPNIYEYSDCHGHNHFGGFARFDVFELRPAVSVQDLATVVPGGKLAYCMEDSIPFFRNPQTQCAGRSVCDDQGIQYGWIDRYPSDLDCQWVVLRQFYRDYPELSSSSTSGSYRRGKWFTYQVCTNFARVFTEKTFNNNCRAFPVYIPNLHEFQNRSRPLQYAEFIAQLRLDPAANPCQDLSDPLPYGVEYPDVCL